MTLWGMREHCMFLVETPHLFSVTVLCEHVVK